MKANLNKFWGSAKLNENLCCVKKSHFGVCWNIVILSYGEKMFFLCRKVLSLDWCIVKSTELSLWFSGAVPFCPRLRSRETLHIVLRAHVSSYILQLTVCFVVVQEVVLGDLKADTSYSVSVGAYTAKGDGARSKPVTVCSALPRKCAYNRPLHQHTTRIRAIKLKHH